MTIDQPRACINWMQIYFAFCIFSGEVRSVQLCVRHLRVLHSGKLNLHLYNNNSNDNNNNNNDNYYNNHIVL